LFSFVFLLIWFLLLFFLICLFCLFSSIFVWIYFLYSNFGILFGIRVSFWKHVNFSLINQFFYIDLLVCAYLLRNRSSSVIFSVKSNLVVFEFVILCYYSLRRRFLFDGISFSELLASIVSTKHARRFRTLKFMFYFGHCIYSFQFLREEN
jgi:hypothetical protein